MSRVLETFAAGAFLVVFALPVSAALSSPPALAAEPLVDAAWVKANLGKDGVVFLDATSNPSGCAQGHVPGAVFTHYGKDVRCVDGKTNGHKVPGMLPSAGDLEKQIGGLGVGNADHVVIVANGYGAADMGAETQILWIFKVRGHEEVSTLFTSHHDRL